MPGPLMTMPPDFDPAATASQLPEPLRQPGGFLLSLYDQLMPHDPTGQLLGPGSMGMAAGPEGNGLLDILASAARKMPSQWNPEIGQAVSRNLVEPVKRRLSQTLSGLMAREPNAPVQALVGLPHSLNETDYQLTKELLHRIEPEPTPQAQALADHLNGWAATQEASPMEVAPTATLGSTISGKRPAIFAPKGFAFQGRESLVDRIYPKRAPDVIEAWRTNEPFRLHQKRLDAEALGRDPRGVPTDPASLFKRTLETPERVSGVEDLDSVGPSQAPVEARRTLLGRKLPAGPKGQTTRENVANRAPSDVPESIREHISGAKAKGIPLAALRTKYSKIPAQLLRDLYNN
jgi:hypothetical protein